MSGAAQMPWWFTQNEEMLHGSRRTREEAIKAGTIDFEGEPFMVCQGGHFRNSCAIFDIDWLSERFDDANEEYAGEDGCPSQEWKREHGIELERELEAVMTAWAKRHGYDKAWAIDCGPYETITPEVRA
jgi:hypothetical protein